MSEIYLITVEYEIIRLVTTDWEEWLKQLSEIAKEDGTFHPGDWAEVWINNKRLYSVYRMSDLRMSVS